MFNYTDGIFLRFSEAQIIINYNFYIYMYSNRNQKTY